MDFITDIIRQAGRAILDDGGGVLLIFGFIALVRYTANRMAR